MSYKVLVITSSFNGDHPSSTVLEFSMKQMADYAVNQINNAAGKLLYKVETIKLY